MADTDKTLEILIKLGYINQDQAKAAAADLEKIGETTEETGRSTEEFNVKGRAQFMLFEQINRILPGLGTTMHAAFTGPLGPIILVGIAIASAKKALDDYNTSLDKLGEEAAAGHAEQIKAISDAWDKVEQSMAKYFADMQAAAQDKDPTKTLIENLKNLEEEQYKATLKEMELADQPQAQIDAFKDEHDKKTVRNLMEERRLREQDQIAAEAAVDTDKKAAASADARINSRKAEVENLGKPDPALEAAQKRLADLSAQWMPKLGRLANSPEDMAEYQRQMDEAQGDVNRITDAIARRKRQLADANQADLTAKAEADKKLSEDQGKAVAAKSRVGELSGPQGEIAQTGLGRSVEESGRAANATIDQAKTMIKNHTDLFGSLAATFKYYNHNAGSMANEVAALHQEIEDINKQLAGLPHF